MERLPAPSKLDAGLVRRLIEAQFPHWAELPIRPVRHMGWDNRTFRLGPDMVVRLPSAGAYAGQVTKEQRWLPVLAPKLPLPIPFPLAMGEPGAGYPWHWSIYSWLPGEPLSVRHVPDTGRLAGSLANFLVAPQRIDPREGPRPGPDNFYRGGTLTTYDGEARRAISLLEGRIDARAASRAWDAAIEPAHDGSAVWVHGDVSFPNLLVRKGELAGVIDFGCLAVGDPACDLAVAWSWMSRQSRCAFRSALPLDEATWARARGWALWKALVVLAGLSPAHRGAQEQAGRALQEVLRDDNE
ncbi:MAG: aminoglycoside phosphotransferase family protein [Pseudomonadota bacterium]|nr:aminoglycoside phosphotransferase family protein [Pseudomonadota bacterium]